MIGTSHETDIRDIGVEHVVSRSVRDSAALFALTEDSGKAAQLPPVGLVTAPGKRRLRIGVLLENGMGHSPEAEVAAANASAAKLLASLGHRIEYTRLPFDGGQFIQDFLLLWASGAMGLADALTKAMGKAPDTSVLEPFSLGMVEVARKAGPQAVGAAVGRLQANALAYDTWFPSHQFDVVLSPVLSSPAPKLGVVGPLVDFDTLTARLTEYVGYTPIHNIAGAPLDERAAELDRRRPAGREHVLGATR